MHVEQLVFSSRGEFRGGVSDARLASPIFFVSWSPSEGVSLDVTFDVSGLSIPSLDVEEDLRQLSVEMKHNGSEYKPPFSENKQR